MNEENHNIQNLYAHIPFCDGKCAYCAFFSTLYESAAADRFLAALEMELALISAGLKTIYVGGGTPTMLSTNQLKRLCDAICRNFSFKNPVEWTFEANPGSLTRPKTETLVSAGVNRISLGAQSFHEAALLMLGRRHSSRDTIAAVDMIRKAGIKNLNLDLIACIPEIKMEYWKETLLKAVELAPEHLSVYALTPEEGSLLNMAVTKGEMNMLSDEEQLDALDIAEVILNDAGYQRYEISNYALPGFECRHNQSCWRGDEYIGVGPAAASHIGMERRVNAPDISFYMEALEQGEKPHCDSETLTSSVKDIERVIFGLRMSEGISETLGAKFQNKLNKLENDGLVVFNNGRWTLTRFGRNLADYIGSELTG